MTLCCQRTLPTVTGCIELSLQGLAVAILDMVVESDQWTLLSPPSPTLAIDQARAIILEVSSRQMSEAKTSN
jgi:hypothetical protein